MCKRFKVDNGVQSLPWSSQSPDCNPIENIWALMKLKINKQPPTSMKIFMARIRKEWKNLPVDFAAKLVNSMKYRIELLIERNRATTSVSIEEIALTDLTDLSTSSRDIAREISSVTQTTPLVNPLNSMHIYIVKRKKTSLFGLMF
ncbi:unnamed protein product [Rotaria sp. Silwood1]|nr:unnamed protein product [Rotaria sp. Silwood1]